MLRKLMFLLSACETAATLALLAYMLHATDPSGWLLSAKDMLAIWPSDRAVIPFADVMFWLGE